MKLLQSIAVFAALATPAAADPFTDNLCNAIFDMSEVVMRARQAGMPQHMAASALDGQVLDGSSEAQEASKMMFDDIVGHAYNIPVAHDTFDKFMAIAEFSALMKVSCYSAVATLQ